MRSEDRTIHGFRAIWNSTTLTVKVIFSMVGTILDIIPFFGLAKFLHRGRKENGYKNVLGFFNSGFGWLFGKIGECLGTWIVGPVLGFLFTPFTKKGDVCAQNNFINKLFNLAA